MSGLSRLPNAHKAAVLVLALGPETAGPMLQHLPEHELERLTRAVTCLGAVSSDVVAHVIAEFEMLTAADVHLQTGDVEAAQALLEKSCGPETARRILARITGAVNATAGFDALEKMAPPQIAEFLSGEHPQMVAVILAHLQPPTSAGVVAHLPDGTRADVLVRLATLGEVAPETVQDISLQLAQRMKHVMTAKREQHGGVRTVATLCNRLDRATSQAVLETMDAQDAALAQSIRNLMFVFDDIHGLDDAALREIIRHSDKKLLATALKGAPETLRARFFQNMSKRAADMLRDDLEVMGPVRVRDVEKAQQDIVGVVRKLEEGGHITTTAVGDEAFVN